MADRLLEIRDRVAEVIADRLGDPPAAVVSVDWTFRVSREDGSAFSGRMVFVEGVGDSGLPAPARGYDRDEYLIRITTVETYSGSGSPPPAWVDGICNWVTETLGPLGDERSRPLKDDEAFEGVWPDRYARTVACDRECLRTQGMFWSEVEIAFREDAPSA